MLKTLKNQKGFTLVEVIVVAVIVLILAAAAIPLYNGYISDSRQNIASNTAGSVASAFAAAVQADLDNTGSTDWEATDGSAVTAKDATTLTEIKIKGISGKENILAIPKGYTVKWDGEKAWGYYTDNPPTAGEEIYYTYRVGTETTKP